MVQPSKGTVNDITVGSATGAVDTHIATYQTACIQCRSKHCAEYGDGHEDERRVKFFQKPCARYIVTSKTSTASEPLSVSTTSAARKRGGTRRPPLPPLLPLPSLSTGGRGGARHEAHPAPPRCFFSRRGGTVADATVDHQHLFLELRLPLLLLLLLLLLQSLLEEELGSGVVDPVKATERLHREDRSSHRGRCAAAPLRPSSVHHTLGPQPNQLLQDHLFMHNRGNPEYSRSSQERERSGA